MITVERQEGERLCPDNATGSRALAAAAVVAVSGCGDKGPKMYKVSGTVKYTDGTPVRGGVEGGRAAISFAPADPECTVGGGRGSQAAHGDD